MGPIAVATAGLFVVMLVWWTSRKAEGGLQRSAAGRSGRTAERRSSRGRCYK